MKHTLTRIRVEVNGRGSYQEVLLPSVTGVQVLTNSETLEPYNCISNESEEIVEKVKDLGRLRRFIV
ncbi:hypothetical protein DAPPUDRAFT_238147 [Daphnia pulex]|uniref:Uncharacterized protein n=1 Tax=Daphnia pulex TaxID=6669 RepID=E9G6S1_DAPPU|nr:hypothetical protein DAPPUDRAFT_238147 [Daphnia pulex]|eukprot:EFX85140.1 hypothetical protein DAPPUDRAFT_238147 [Daphnia pulex]